ncbi:hypothetical protein CY34DRAFT_14796 [Suillus luteus UH-Slu-Lm8-n1]|uniref:Uncharacterized protein n=1 Tax=Suillus luteus UH-Slu-Lm8-n1 TaxID=930992 RepID=A0A0D0AL03_9AGAM|nr:hypothetical protein CY34DRAFT_14796 [Suillus luteus UH-Slu-Lm8-n1]
MDMPSHIDDDIPVQSCGPENRGDEDTLYDAGDEEDLEEQGQPPEESNDIGFEGEMHKT